MNDKKNNKNKEIKVKRKRRKFKKLSLEERERLAILKAEGKKLREIAKILGRSHSTLSRELRFKSGKIGDPSKYVPVHAEGLAQTQRRLAGRKPRMQNQDIRNYGGLQKHS